MNPNSKKMQNYLRFFAFPQCGEHRTLCSRSKRSETNLYFLSPVELGERRKRQRKKLKKKQSTTFTVELLNRVTTFLSTFVKILKSCFHFMWQNLEIDSFHIHREAVMVF